jgi:hypothetical protein
VCVCVCFYLGHKDGWTGYSWNPDCFKDPEGFLKWCSDQVGCVISNRVLCSAVMSPGRIVLQGLAVTLNLHPADGVGPHETAYRDVCQSLGKPPTGQRVPFDVTNNHYMHAYFKYLHHPLEKQGISFWWIDWQQGDLSRIRGLDPMFWLNHLHCVDMEKRGKRSLILSRWAGLGGHRYQIGFSGDTYSNWDSLEFQIKMTVPLVCVLTFRWRLTWSMTIVLRLRLATCVTRIGHTILVGISLVRWILKCLCAGSSGPCLIP